MPEVVDVGPRVTEVPVFHISVVDQMCAREGRVDLQYLVELNDGLLVVPRIIKDGAGVRRDEETVVLDQYLAAGTYYLVLEGLNPEESVNWTVSDGTYAQNAGTVTAGEWISTDNGTTWDFYAANEPPCTVIPCNAPLFDVNGTPGLAPTREPDSGVLMVLGLAVLGFVALRRIRLGHPIPS